MNKKYLIIIVLTVVLVGAIFYGAKILKNEPQQQPPTDKHADLIQATSPTSGQTISSPLTVTGKARGNWYFEASFPVKLMDGNGKIIASAPAQAQGEWMTNDFVPFKVMLNFSTPTTSNGTLILEKDNPSGLPQNADQISIPVKFEQQTRSVKLFYYDANKDKDASGNIICSKQGLVAVDRKIPTTITPIQDSIKLLIAGNLSADEKAQGITTEFPLSGFTLKGANLNNGTLTLEFSDPQGKTSGGSCRITVLWAQIEATAEQFSGVTQVTFKPAELFQP